MSKKILIYFIISLVLTGVSYLFIWPDYIGICPTYNEVGHYSCVDQYDFLAEPAFYFFGAFTTVLLLFLISSQPIHKAWKKFALWYIPLSVVLIAITSDQNHFLLPIDRELVTWWTAGGFVVISLLLMGYTAWRERHAQT